MTKVKSEEYTGKIKGVMAGVKIGCDDIPSCWLKAPRDKDKADNLINKLILNIRSYAGEKE